MKAFEELNLKVESVMKENAELNSSLLAKSEETKVAKKQVESISSKKEELDRLAALFSTSTPSSEDEGNKSKSNPELPSQNVVDSLFQIKQGN